MVRYMSVLEYEDGSRSLVSGKEDVTGEHLMGAHDLEDMTKLSFNRIVLYRLPTEIPRDQFQKELENLDGVDDLPDWFPAWLYQALEEKDGSDGV